VNFCGVGCSVPFISKDVSFSSLDLLLLKYNETEPLRQGGKKVKTLLRERGITVSTGHPIRQYIARGS